MEADTFHSSVSNDSRSRHSRREKDSKVFQASRASCSIFFQSMASAACFLVPGDEGEITASDSQTWGHGSPAGVPGVRSQCGHERMVIVIAA